MQVTDTSLSPGGLVVREMHVLYGARFAQQWQGLSPRELRAAWDQKLTGMAASEIETGLAACLAREWPPTLPEFMRLCRPWMSPEVAYHEAVAGMVARSRGEMGHWEHPAIYWAAVTTGAHDLVNRGYSTLKTRWEKAFAAEVAKGRWHAVPAVQQVLPMPGRGLATREQAEAALRQLGVEAEQERTAQRDRKAWAKRILDKRRAGPAPSLAMVVMARRALGLELKETAGKRTQREQV